MASPAYAAVTSVAGGFKSGANNIAVPSSGANAAGDVMVVLVYKEALGETVTSTNFVKPSDGSAGFDEVANSNHSLYIGYKRLTANDSGNYSVNVGGTNAWTELACVKITGCITTGSPWDVIGTPGVSVGNVTASPNTSNTTTVVETLQFFVATNFTGGAWTAASGMTERYDGSGNLTVDTLAQAGIGGSGTKSATCAGSGRSISWLGALKPAASAASANAGHAAATAAAYGATGSLPASANAGHAAATAAAHGPTAGSVTTASAGHAAATASAYGATVSISTSAAAGHAAAVAAAYGATASGPVVAYAGHAAAIARAYSTPTFEFPGTNLGLIVEIAPGADPLDDPDDWPWVDITEFVMARAAMVAIKITRGATSETSRAPAPTCSFELNNRDGRFSTRNYNGPYWPLLIKGTPVRVRIDDGPIQSVRFTGRMDELPPRWDISGNDMWVPVTASGIRRRLSKPITVPPPATSAATSEPDYLASWACTDGQGSQGAAEASGGPPLLASGSVTWQAIVGPDGISRLPSLLTGGILSGQVPTAVTTEWTAQASLKIDNRSPGTWFYPLSVECSDARQFLLEACEIDAATRLWTVSADGTQTEIISSSWWIRDGAWHTLSIRCEQDGADIDVDLRADGVSIGAATVAGATLSRPTRVNVGDGQSGCGLISAGYVSVLTTSTPTDTSAAVMGHVGETAQERFERLAAAANVPYEVFGTSDAQMGPQSDADLGGQFEECAAVDGGILTESREGRMAMYCRSLVYNADVALTLDMANKELADAFEPDDTTAAMYNIATASMSRSDMSGVSRTVRNEAHIEKYQEYEAPGLALNAAYPAQLTAAAGDRVWQGVQEMYRYPRVAINLARHPQLAATCVDLDIYDRMTVDNPPDPIVEDPDVVLIGSVEELGAKWWRQVWSTIRYAPFDVGVTSDDVSGKRIGWLVPRSLVTAEAVDLTETAIDVTPSALLPLTASGQYPIDIRIDAEVMTVTDCSGAGPTQTLTVARGVSGLQATHDSGATVKILNALILTR